MHGAEKPGGLPKIRKLAMLKQYGFLYGIPPGFSPSERFFRQKAEGAAVAPRLRRGNRRYNLRLFFNSLNHFL